MARKGQFKKGGGRVGGGSSSRKRSRSRATTAIVIAGPRAPARRHRSHAITHHKKGRRRGARRGGHGGVTPAKLLVSSIVLASAAGTNNGPLGDKIYNLVQKVPGAKTFGGAATAGLLCGGLYKFTKIGGRLRPWLAAAGVVGIVGAALKVGEQGTNFKWLGDDDQVMDVID
jgi:hypothetical protein